MEFHIFGFWEVIVEVEVFDVSDDTFSSWIRNDTVEETFCGGDGGSVSTQQSREIKKVSADC